MEVQEMIGRRPPKDAFLRSQSLNVLTHQEMRMLSYDRSGLYVEGALSASAKPTGQEERIRGAIEALEERFESGELGFVDTPDTEAGPIQAFARERLSEEWTDQVVIGIGGSSLGARAVLQSASPRHRRGLRTHFADNLDPESVDRLFSWLDPRTTLVVVITKSGTTIETMSQFWIVRELIRKAVGPKRAARHIVAVTDPKGGALRELVDRHGWYDFSVPPNVGGRFSVLTPVGLVPLALAGYPIDELLEGARKARNAHRSVDAAAQSWGVMAAEHIALAEQGFDQLVMMTYGDRLSGLVDWFSQLWAESLGKIGEREGERVHTGITPIKAVGVSDQHSQVQLYMEGPKDKHVSFLEVENFDRDRVIPETPEMPEALQHLQGRRLSEVFGAELQGTRGALREAGRPTSTWKFERVSPATVGAFLFSWQMITAVAGELLEINAFDQPGVELGKKIAHGLLGRQDHEEVARRAQTHAESATEVRTSILD